VDVADNRNQSFTITVFTCHHIFNPVVCVHIRFAVFVPVLLTKYVTLSTKHIIELLSYFLHIVAVVALADNLNSVQGVIVVQDTLINLKFPVVPAVVLYTTATKSVPSCSTSNDAEAIAQFTAVYQAPADIVVQAIV
jgi:hypothetical protein